MTTPCLAATGLSLTSYLVGGFTILGLGLVVARYAKPRVALLLLVLAATGVVITGPSARPAAAACNPTTTTLVPSLATGTVTVRGGDVRGALPTFTATSGGRTITALWTSASFSRGSTTLAFRFPHLAAGNWTFEFADTNSAGMEFGSASIPFAVSSSPMLTGGPLDATTTALVSVPSSGLTFTLTADIPG